MAVSPVGGDGSEPTCPRHPDVVTYVRCQRCGRPTCPACQRVAPVGVQCVDCVNEARSKQRAVRSRLGITIAKGPPFVTIALIAINVAVFLYGLTLQKMQLFSEWGLWPKYGPQVRYLGAGDEWWRWITSGFVHGGVLHIGMNMFVLWMFGRQVETLLGRVRFALVYFTSLLGGSAMVVLLGEQGSVVGGASGAIFGLVGAYVAIAITLKLPFQSVAIQAGIWLVLGFTISGVSWQGHVGGALTGWIVTVVILRLAARRKPPPLG